MAENAIYRVTDLNTKARKYKIGTLLIQSLRDSKHSRMSFTTTAFAREFQSAKSQAHQAGLDYAVNCSFSETQARLLIQSEAFMNDIKNAPFKDPKIAKNLLTLHQHGLQAQVVLQLSNAETDTLCQSEDFLEYIKCGMVSNLRELRELAEVSVTKKLNNMSRI